MSSDKMRAEFEKWAMSPDGPVSIESADRLNGDYLDRQAARGWMVWQAASAVTTDLLQTKDMEINQLKFCIDGEAPLKAVIDSQAAEIARLTVYATACDGITQDHLDGGWTASGLSKYAKGLEAEIARLTDKLAQANARTVTDTALPVLREHLKIAAVMGDPVTLSSNAAASLFYSMATGLPMPPDATFAIAAQKPPEAV